MRKRIADLVAERHSCRAYLDRPIDDDVRGVLADFLASKTEGPLGTPLRFALVAATAESRAALKGLGTYGFIDGATGFIVGAMAPGPKSLEDYGYTLEHAVLLATELGLGTCWLGGTFTKSSFARAIAVHGEETVPAVIATGYAAAHDGVRELTRLGAGSKRRLPREQLFFDGAFGAPLETGRSGPFDQVLEGVRWAPSASNRQPWRIVRRGDAWHFYLQRTPHYGRGSLKFMLLGLADLQRVDMGIAMCHWELGARDLGLAGRWVIEDPGLPLPTPAAEYVASWI